MKFKLRLLLSLLPFCGPFCGRWRGDRFAGEVFGQKLTGAFFKSSSYVLDEPRRRTIPDLAPDREISNIDKKEISLTIHE